MKTNPVLRHPLFFVIPILLVFTYIYSVLHSAAMPVLLWTDVLVYLLVLAVSVFVVVAAGKELANLLSNDFIRLKNILGRLT